jgi:hypothetical protein
VLDDSFHVLGLGWLRAFTGSDAKGFGEIVALNELRS